MCLLSVSGSDSHWGVSQYLEFPWLLEAKAETVRLMRVFMDMDPREILENADEFFNVLECMYVVVTDGPCYFKGEDLGLFAFEGVVGGANRILRWLPSGGP